MFEIVGSGSSSSDSIVNISHSGASSISISATSNTSDNNDKLTTEDKLRTEITKLREDNKVLKGRIRGVKTLSDLLAEYRRENEQLKAQLSTLTMSMQAMDPPTSVSSVASPFSLVSMQAAAQQRQSTVVTLQPTVPEQRPPSSLSPSLRGLGLDSKEPPPISHPPASGPPSSSLQETVGPPGHPSKENKLISLTSPTNTQHKPEQSMKQDVTRPEPATTKVSYPPGPASLAASDMSAPELLQLDSDKYDEATYEKVGLQLGLGHAGLSGSMYAAGGGRGGEGGSRGAESRPIDFPSLSSENSTCLTHSHSSAVNPPPYMAMMQQSMPGPGPGGVSRAGGMDLASQQESMSERLHSGPGDSMAAMASHMHQMAERISRTESKDRQQRKLIDTLMCENQDLKNQIKAAESMHKEEVATLREENSRLAQQLQSQRPRDSGETTRTGTSPSLSTSPSQGDWVHIKQSGAETPDDTDHSLVDRVRALEQEKAELLRANMNWKRQWDHLEQGHQVKVTELRNKLAQAEQELSAHRVRLAEQTSEFESRMLEIKRRITDEENLKEEAQHQQRLSERQCSELQEQLREMRTQLSDTARQKQALATELSVIKANTAEQGASQQSRAANASNTAARSSLEAEITMLKEQLKVFAEDFEQERLDRTTAQASRDSAKKTAEQIGRQNHTLSTQVKHLQKQIKDRDDTISWTLRQNENLQRQAADYKKKLAGEWEEKQSLQRRMLSLEQQLQQSPRRNPYLSNNTEPIMTYHNPLPVHQPPPPPTRAAYYGGQGLGGGGGAQAAARARTPTLSPEHLPGAWTCQACTYINFPGRTVCESCGCINNPRAGGYPDQLGFNSHDMYGSEHALLMSRGGEQAQNGVIPASSGDLVVDSGQWTTTPN